MLHFQGQIQVMPLTVQIQVMLQSVQIQVMPQSVQIQVMPQTVIKHVIKKKTHLLHKNNSEIPSEEV